MTKARGRIPPSAQVRWTDQELSAAVSAYLFLLLLQQKGTTEDVLRAGLKFAASELFAKRTADSVKYRMRNISAVFEENGWASITIFPSADRVGSKVNARIREIAKKHPLHDLAKKPQKSSIRPVRHGQPGKQASVYVSALVDALRDREQQPGIGHNSPPEPISNDDFAGLAELKRTAEQLLATLQKLDLSKNTVAQTAAASVKAQRGILVRVGIKLAVWLGRRATKVVDAAIALYLANAAGLMPYLTNAIAAVGRWLAHIGS